MHSLDAELVGRGLSATGQRLRIIEHAITALRRGLPAVLAADPASASPRLVLLAAETAGAEGLAAFQARAAGTPILVLTAARAEAVLPPVSGALAGFRPLRGAFGPQTLHALADPTRPQDHAPVEIATPPAGRTQPSRWPSLPACCPQS